MIFCKKFGYELEIFLGSSVSLKIIRLRTEIFFWLTTEKLNNCKLRAANPNKLMAATTLTAAARVGRPKLAII